MSIGEFLETLLSIVCEKLYDGLYLITNNLYKGMFDSLNKWIATSTGVVNLGPVQWNASAYLFIKRIAEDVCIPVAGCIITFVFCLEMIRLVQQDNHMHPVKPEDVLIILTKLCIFLYIASRSFDIVDGIAGIGRWAAQRVNPSAASDLTAPSLDELIKSKGEGELYDFGDVFMMMSNLLLVAAARILSFAVAVAIYVKVNIWYMELLVYMSVAPIPMSTFMNREWGQMGQNYVRKMLAVGFEGFFMLLMFGLYSALLTKVATGGGDDFTWNMLVSVGCGAALLLMLAKSGNISASVFNAH